MTVLSSASGTDAGRSASSRTSFDSLAPATGKRLASYPIGNAEQVEAAVERARSAFDWWGSLSFDERKKHLSAWRALIARRVDEFAELVSAETGKPRDDAVLEILLTLDHMDWAAKNAKKVLGPHKVSSGTLAANHEASVEYPPLGVIGVIGPWNYPVFTPMGSIGYALAAGNTVVFKPSEYTPGVGTWLADTFGEAVPGHPDVFQTVTGLGDTGAALCTARVGKLAFTGSSATGRKVMAACAQNLTPVLMECGGKDALIVDEDADVDAAAGAAIWGGMSNSGQTCIGTERVYVHEKRYDQFVDAIRRQAGDVVAGESYGAMTMPSQIDVVRRHVEDALEHGATAVVGGAQSIRPPFVDPVVLVDVPDDSVAITEETFGPTLTVTKVHDIDEAVAKANATGYGLASAVFSGKRGMEIARRLRTGMTSVNSVITFASIPELPFGGIGESGFGRIHGPDGLKEFTRAKAISRQRWTSPLNLTSFRKTGRLTDVLVRIIRLRYGRG
ncbi:MAG TPA: aldehyde dehydrogenase family protein [Frankiaceae bacterium]|nr:aldehyde dehydrogenase family protein [Frankiaceae bacterium]